MIGAMKTAPSTDYRGHRRISSAPRCYPPRDSSPHIVRSKTTEPSCHPIRPSTARRPSYPHDSTSAAPKDHMAQTYAWVVDQEQTRLDKQNKKTEQWVTEQIFLANSTNQRRSPRPPEQGEVRWRLINELMSDCEVKAQTWMKQEETRRRAAEREQEKSRIVQEEIKRIQTRVRQRTQSEMHRMAEERQRGYETSALRERKQRARADQAMVEAWATYDSRWSAISTSSEPLTFNAIPWPLLSLPSSPADIDPVKIAAFILSSAHSQSQSRKDRIRTALLRWHPDRFRRLLAKVSTAEKDVVEEGVGIVTRCLNEMMAGDVRAP